MVDNKYEEPAKFSAIDIPVGFGNEKEDRGLDVVAFEVKKNLSAPLQRPRHAENSAAYVGMLSVTQQRRLDSLVPIRGVSAVKVLI